MLTRKAIFFRWRLIYWLLFSTPSFSALYQDLGALEKKAVDLGLARYDLVATDLPDGKRVKKIYIFTVSPFFDEESALRWLNNLHIDTKEEVIRRELIQKEGELYDQAAVRDSELSLRGQSRIRSLAVIIPVKPSDGALADDEISLLVVTRDLLSLLPKFSFAGSGLKVNSLSVSLNEYNLFGYNKSISVIYDMRRGHHILSALYLDPQLMGSALRLMISPSLIYSREDFGFQGFLGEISLKKPLRAQSDRFGYGINFSYGSQNIIDFNGREVRKYDIPKTTAIEELEGRYHWRYAGGGVVGEYSMGLVYKRNIFFGYGFNLKRPSICADMNLKRIERQFYRENILPRNEFESFVTLGIGYFHNQFITLYDYENFRRQEVVRIGPGFTLFSDFSSKILFSDTNFLRPGLKLSYVQPLGLDSFVHLFSSGSSRYDGGFSDNTYKGGLSVVSPKILGIGRAIFEGRLSLIRGDRDHQKFNLGSDSGLRGVDPGYYSGATAFRGNVEFRTVPLDISILQVGAAMFYDVGAAFDHIDRANATHSVGLGIRVLAPQLNAIPIRIDLAFPIFGAGRRDHFVVPSFGTGQAF